jgi:hypothetical protein
LDERVILGMVLETQVLIILMTALVLEVAGREV